MYSWSMTKLTRSFEVPEDLDALLASRSAAEDVPKAELARRFVGELLTLDPSDIPLGEPTEARVLRRYHLERDQDSRLDRLRKKLDVSKGRLFRAALRHGLAIEVKATATRAAQAPQLLPDVVRDLVAAVFLDLRLNNLTSGVEASVMKLVQVMVARFPVAVTRSQLREDVRDPDTFDEALDVVLRQPQVRTAGQQIQLVSHA